MKFKPWLLNEEEVSGNIPGLDNLMSQIEKRHHLSDSLKNKIKQFIISSGTPKIEITDLRLALGASLHDRVIINSGVFYHNLPHILYVVFHEIAHQYQYKKHGFAEMFKYFEDELATSEAVKILRRGENIADNYAIRKLKKLQQEGEEINTSGLYGYYKSMSDNQLAQYIQMVKKNLKAEDVKNPEKISSTLWNLIKTN